MLFRSDDDWPSASSAVLCALGSASHQPCKVQSTTLGVESGYIVGTDHCHGSIELLQRMFKIFWVQFHVVAPTFFRNQNSYAKLSHRGACCTVENRPSSASISSESLSDSFSSPVLRRFSRRSCKQSNPKVKWYMASARRVVAPNDSTSYLKGYDVKLDPWP